MTVSRASLWSRRAELAAFAELGGPVLRTHPLLERLFPRVVWGIPAPAADSPVHLTFDDGPAGDGTLRILDVLAKHEIPATFFLRGQRIPGGEDVIDRVLDAGHRIGYHGLTHSAWWFRSHAHRRVEIDPLMVLRAQPNPFAVGDGRLLLRAPYGRLDFAAIATARELGGRIVHWRVSLRDWAPGVSPSSLSRLLYRYVYPGDIVLLHDGGESAGAVAGALDRTLPALKRAGVTFTDITRFLPDW